MFVQREHDQRDRTYFGISQVSIGKRKKNSDSQRIERVPGFGRRLKEARRDWNKAHGEDVTWATVAERAQVSASSLSQIVSGEQTPSAMQAVRLAAALECDLEWLLTPQSEDLAALPDEREPEEDAETHRERTRGAGPTRRRARRGD